MLTWVPVRTERQACVSPTVTVADIIADPSVRQGVSAADGSVVGSVETLTLSSLAAAELLAADFPPTKRVFTRVPRRPLRPHSVHCKETEVTLTYEFGRRSLCWALRLHQHYCGVRIKANMFSNDSGSRDVCVDLSDCGRRSVSKGLSEISYDTDFVKN